MDREEKEATGGISIEKSNEMDDNPVMVTNQDTRRNKGIHRVTWRRKEEDGRR